MVTGVNFQEIDQSTLIPLRPGGRIAMAGPLSKGIIGEFRDIDSSEQFRREYGGRYARSNFSDYCVQALDGGAKLRVSRVAHATDPNDASTLTAIKATVSLLDRAGAVAGPAVLQSSNPGPWLIPDGTTFTLDVNGTPEPQQTVSVDPAQVTTGTNETAPWDFTGGVTLEVKVGGTSEPTQIIPIPDSKFSTVTAGTAAELAQAINDEAPIGMTAVVTGTGPNFTVSLISDQRGTGARIQVIGGTANAFLTFPTTEQSGAGDFIDHRAVTPAELATYLQGPAHGTTYNNTSDATSVSFTSVAVGATATMGFDAPSTGALILGLTPGTDVTGSPVSAAANTLRVDALSEGIWAENISFEITDGTLPDRFNLTVPIQPGVESLEFYEDLNLDPISSKYVVNYVNQRSRTIRVTNLNSATVAPNNIPANGTFNLTGGNDGLTGLTGNDFLGGALSKFGVHAFDGGGDVIDVMVPTIHEDATGGIPAAMISIKDYAENRRDMVYHSVPPNPEDAFDSIAFRNGTAPYSHQKFNSSYMSMMISKGILNLSDGQREFNAQAQLPSVLSYNDTGNGRQFENVGPWFSPAGDKRGRTKFTSIRPQLSAEAQNDPTRASLEANQINYLATLDGRVLVWNNATLQVATSALSDIEVRRAMIFFETQITKAILLETFEPNDPIFFSAVASRIDEFLGRVQARRGVFDYAIFCDQDVDDISQVRVNTPEDIDQGIFKCKIFIKPTRTAKEIQLLFTITATGVDFAEVFDA